jgi:hypothetical protein
VTRGAAVPETAGAFVWAAHPARRRAAAKHPAHARRLCEEFCVVMK